MAMLLRRTSSSNNSINSVFSCEIVSLFFIFNIPLIYHYITYKDIYIYMSHFTYFCHIIHHSFTIKTFLSVSNLSILLFFCLIKYQKVGSLNKARCSFAHGLTSQSPIVEKTEQENDLLTLTTAFRAYSLSSLHNRRQTETWGPEPDLS